MNARLMTMAVALAMAGNADVRAQTLSPSPRSAAASFVDPVGGLSLSQAVERALAQEPSLAGVRKQIDVARGQRRQAELRPNPTVAFEQRTEPQGTDALTAVTLDWPLDLFRRSGRTATADAQIAATSLGVAERERRVAGEVRMRYGEVLVAIRELEVLDRVIETASTQREVLAARVAEGGSPPLDRDLLQVEVNRLQANRQLQIGRVEAAFVDLKRWLGMPPAAPLAVRDRLDDAVQTEAGRDSAASADPSQRSDVREAEARVHVAEAAVEQADREGRMDISLFGSYMRMDSGFPQMGFTASGSLERVRGVFHYVSAGVRVSLPVMNRNQGAQMSAEAERDAARAALAGARLAADAEAAAARARLERAEDAVRTYRTGVQSLAAQNLSVVLQSYGLGRLTVLDVLAEQRRFLEIERGFADALRTAFEARTALELAMGVVR